MATGPTIADIEHGLTHAFHRTILARYKCSLDLYHVVEDDCGGRVKRTERDDPELEPGEAKYFEIRYGFRHLRDGRICVVAYLPDFEKLPAREREAWLSDLVRHKEFAEPDRTYDRWKGRILEGEWNSAGPLELLRDEIHRARAVTSAAGMPPLFKGETNPLLHYPIGENSAELLAATVELERLVVEGLDAQSIRDIAVSLGVTLACGSGTLTALKAILPPPLVPVIHSPLAALRDARNSIHRVPAPAPEPLPAFDQFLERARATAASVAELNLYLSGRLGIDPEQAIRRLDILESSMHPQIAPLPRRHADTDNLDATVGKTIASVTIGGVSKPDMGYSRDGIEIAFTDGSMIVIDPIANTGNWEDRVQGFDKREMNVRLDVTLVPNARCQ